MKRIIPFFSSIALLLALTLGLGLFMISCDDKEQTFASKELIIKAPVRQVRFIGQWLNEGKRGKLIKDFVREYEFLNQEVEVILSFPEELFDDYQDRKSNVRVVNELINSSEPAWDIIRLNNQFKQIRELRNDSLWAKKYLVDFSQIPDFVNNTNPDLISDKNKKAWGGIIPGPFIEGSYWALWTNKVITQKLGIEVKTKGMTFDDFMGYLQAVNKYNIENPNDYIVPIHEAYDWETSFAFIFQLYASALNDNDALFSMQVSENKLMAWHKTLKALEELAKYNPYSSTRNSISWEESNCDLLNEQCLFYVNGSWMYNIWESNDPIKTLNVFPAELPLFNPIDNYPSATFITWGVLKNSPNRDEAVRLLLAMNKPEMADRWVQQTKCPTGIKGRLTDLAFGSDQFEDFSNHIQNNYGSNTYNWEEEVCEYINGNDDSKSLLFREVITGQLSADEAMEIIRSNI